MALMYGFNDDCIAIFGTYVFNSHDFSQMLNGQDLVCVLPFLSTQS